MALEQAQIDILRAYAEAVKKRYIDRLQAVKATGRSERSIRIQMNPNGFNIYAGQWFPAIQYGRGKSKGGGNSGFYKRILDWVRVKKNFTIAENVKEERIAKSLQILINKKGTKTGRLVERNILSGVDTRDLDKKLISDMGRSFVTQITEATLNQSKFKFVKVTVTNR